MRYSLLFIALLALAGCANAGRHDTEHDARVAPAVAEPDRGRRSLAERPAPQTTDAFGIREAPDEVVRRYYHLLGEGRFAEARDLWSDGGNASNLSPAEFGNAMARHQAYKADVGAPGFSEGAAGSIYVEVPVRLRSIVRGEPFDSEGKVVLRRCNNVPGCSASQLEWRISQLVSEPHAPK